jgi:hypothetical protein
LARSALRQHDPSIYGYDARGIGLNLRHLAKIHSSKLVEESESWEVCLHEVLIPFSSCSHSILRFAHHTAPKC